MTGRVDAARAAKQIADRYVGADADMTNAHLLVDDGTFRMLAVAREQLTAVNTRQLNYADSSVGDEQYLLAQTEVALAAVDRALSCRAAAVFQQAYRVDYARAGQ